MRTEVGRRSRVVGGLAVVVAVAVSLFAVLRPDRVVGPKSAGPGAPQALTVDDLPAPVGLGLTDVYFGWHVTDGRRGAVHSAYRVAVSRPVLGGPKRAHCELSVGAGAPRG